LAPTGKEWFKNFLTSSAVTGLALVDESLSSKIVDFEVPFTVSLVRSLIVSSFGIGVVVFEASLAVLYSVMRLAVVPSSVECCIKYNILHLQLDLGRWVFPCTFHLSENKGCC